MTEKKTLKQLRLELEKTEDENSDLVIYLKNDSRAGAKKLLQQWQNKQRKANQLLFKFNEMKVFESTLCLKGYKYVAGIDEVGRGPLAGPVVASCVILPSDFMEIGINDSKQLSLQKREELYAKIEEKALAIGIGIIDEETIDKVNIYEATKLAMIEAVNQLSIQPDYLLIDAMKLPLEIPQESLIKGDCRSISIAAASIIAKVTRDRLMIDYHQKFPHYGFDKNAGYGTKVHLAGIEKYGICPIHRKSFAPIKNKL